MNFAKILNASSLPVMSRQEMANLFASGAWRFRADSHEGIEDCEINEDGSRIRPKSTLSLCDWYTEVRRLAEIIGLEQYVPSLVSDYMDDHERGVSPEEFIEDLKVQINERSHRTR